MATNILGQAFGSELLQDVLDKLPTTTMPPEFGGMGTSRPEYQKVNPEYAQYARRGAYTGMGQGGQIVSYQIPTGKTYQGQPLIATYDPQGNFQFASIPEDQYFRPDPNQPNIIVQPKFNKTGGIVDYGVGDTNANKGGFGEMIGGMVSDLSPIILAALGANALAGSGLFTGGAGAAAGAGGNAGALINAGMGGSAAQAASAAANLAATTAGLDAAVLAGGGLVPNVAANFMSPDVIAGAGGAGGAGGAATTGMLSGAPTVTPPAAPPVGAPPVAGAGAGAGTGVTSSVLSAISKATGIDVDTLKTFAPSVIQGLIGAGGSYLQSEQAKEAAQTQADAQIRAAQIAADAARFRPVGVTTRFGSSNFTTDAQGNVIGAGYTPSAEITGYQDRLRTLAGQGMTDIEGARAAYQPLTGAAQSLFGLGQGYLAKTPEQAAQDYISKQQALLTPSRENQLAELRNRQFQTGRGGAATAQGGSLMNTNPEMAAYYNSLAQQDLVLAAQADEEARRRISYGAGLFDTGANLQGRFYTGQTGAYAPFATAMDTSSGLESLAQVPLTLGTQIGAKTTASAAEAGRLTGQGIINAAQTMAPANAYSGTANLLRGVGESTNVAGLLNNAFGVQPQQTSLDAEKLRLFKLIYGT
jgi:hypothetical protein